MAYGKYKFKQALIKSNIYLQIGNTLPINFGHIDKSGLVFRKHMTISDLPISIFIYFNLGINILQSAGYRYIV